jgi:fructose-bisphosphate aldolase class 1
MTELQDKLIEQLDDLIAHLNKYEEKNWSIIFSKIRKLIDNGDRRGLDSLKNMRGGMGSFTDLIICQMNGHRIKKNEESFVNNELMKLGNQVFETSDKLNRELNKNSA